MPITTTPSGGPQGEFSTYTPLYSQTLSANTASITFSNIPTTYTDLNLVVGGITTTTGYSFTLSVNGDTASVYSQTLISSNGTNLQPARYTNAANTSMYIGGWVNGYDSTAPSTLYVDFMNYSNITTNKTILWRSGASNRNVESGVMLWRNTSPITTITISSQGGANMASGSTFTLYGIKAAASQFIPSKASGGDIIATDGTYAYHAFTTSGIFKPAQSLTADYLVIAGGAGGSAGGNGAGGGGAGGFRELSSQSLTTTSYTITIGAGGVGSPGGGTRGTSGGNTTMSGSGFSTITRTGGGGGGICSAVNKPGVSGGSGGGAGATSGTSASVGSGNAGGYTPVEGFAGGLGSSDGVTYDAAGGGGGAGGVGQPATSVINGAGGIGITSSLINAIGAATGLGQLVSSNYYFAGGGGGGSYFKPAGAGGSGGGGIGANTSGVAYGSGLAYSGSGGGGGYVAGGNGGSGVVIVRYPL
jgi:hypothetical protein